MDERLRLLELRILNGDTLTNEQEEYIESQVEIQEN